MGLQSSFPCFRAASQAQDTDITALVEIERNSRHRFEFFMGPVTEEPISARTAYAYAKAGGRTAHGLSVYECRLRQPVFVSWQRQVDSLTV